MSKCTVTLRRSCPTASQVKSLLVTKEVCLGDVEDTELRFHYKEMTNLSVGEDGILRHRSAENPGAGQIVIPRNLTSRVLQMMRDDLGHIGTTKTTTRVKDKFFWPSMSLEIEEWCKTVCRAGGGGTRFLQEERHLNQLSLAAQENW